MTTFNALWGTFKWLLPFGPKVAGDVFQERLNRELRGIPNVHGIADDVLVDGKAKFHHDKCIITLLETVRANNIIFTYDKFIFKSKDLKFIGGNLTPEECKDDLKVL